MADGNILQIVKTNRSAPKQMKLTDTLLSKMKEGERIWDAQLPGLGVQCGKRGATFVLRYRTKGSTTQRQYTIGRFDPRAIAVEIENGIVLTEGCGWNVHNARLEARRLQSNYIDVGIDPLVAIREAQKAAAEESERREAERKSRAEQTVSKVVGRYLTVISTPGHYEYVKESSYRAYEALLRIWVLPRIGDMWIDDVTPQDIKAIIDACRAENRAVATYKLLRSIIRRVWNWSGRDGNKLTERLIGKNARSNVRDRSLSVDEMARLGPVLAGTTSETADIIRLLLFTGARSGEIIDLRWDEIDLGRSVATVSEHKTSRVTGKKSIYFPVQAMDVLNRLRGDDDRNGRVFTVYEIDRPFKAICKAAKIETDGVNKLTPHDLRRTFSQVAGELEISGDLSRLLQGHAARDVHDRHYRNKVSDTRLLAAAQRIADYIAAALEGKLAQPASNVVALRA